jgi:hypothetical protein
MNAALLVLAAISAIALGACLRASARRIDNDPRIRDPWRNL